MLAQSDYVAHNMKCKFLSTIGVLRKTIFLQKPQLLGLLKVTLILNTVFKMKVPLNNFQSVGI
jgi:hypothetical protein